MRILKGLQVCNYFNRDQLQSLVVVYFPSFQALGDPIPIPELKYLAYDTVTP